jgi:hypothetical protein
MTYWGGLAEPKLQTLEEVRKVERTELFNSIFSVIKQIPRKDVDGDAMDALSCAYELEQLFYKWQQERMYNEKDMKLAFETGRNFQLTGEDNFNELIEQFKNK